MATNPIRFGDYVVEPSSGSESAGPVFQVRLETSGLPATVKLIPLPADPGEARRLKEVLPQWTDALRSLDHPAILRVLDLGITGDTGLPYIVYEDFTGESLATLAARGHRFTDLQAVAIASAVTDALVQAHSEGVIHGGVSTESVLVTPDGTVKLADLGLAVSGRVAPGAGAGDTRRFCSPEQIASGPVDPRSDLFSLGVVLFELLVGQTPFQHEGDGYPPSLTATPVAPLPRERRHDLPGPLNALLYRLLQADPGHRPTTAAEVIQALHAAHAKLAAAGPAARPKAAPNMGLWILVAAGLVVILIAAGVMVSILVRPHPKPVVQTAVATPTATNPEADMDRLRLQAAIDAGNLREAQRMIASLRAAGRLGPELIPLVVRADQLGRDQVRPLVERGIELHRQHRYPQAIESFLQALAVTPDDAEVQKLLDASRAARRDYDEDEGGTKVARTRLGMAGSAPEGKELQLYYQPTITKGCVQLDLDGTTQTPVCFDLTKGQFMGIARRTAGTVTGGWSVAAGTHRATMKIVDDSGTAVMDSAFTFQVTAGKRFQARVSSSSDTAKPLLTLAPLTQ